jgi:tripartite-type tricarboxylate transporter receptor subunit TctC
LEEVLTPWNGYFIRSDVPENIKKKITDAIQEAHNSKEYIERVEKAKITRAYLNANDFARFIKESFKILEEPVMR